MKGLPELRGVIDRIEAGKVAVIILDSGQEIHWPASRLPRGAKEGMAVVIRLEVDLEDTRKRLEQSQGLLDDVFSNSRKPAQPRKPAP